MFVVAIAAVLAAGQSDLAASQQRAAFSDCLKQAITQGKASKIGADGFDAFMRSQCAASEAALRTAVVALDMKNGISRKDANANAEMELDDYFGMTAERYAAQVSRDEPQQ
jgi:hypothetical protein